MIDGVAAVRVLIKRRRGGQSVAERNSITWSFGGSQFARQDDVRSATTCVARADRHCLNRGGGLSIVGDPQQQDSWLVTCSGSRQVLSLYSTRETVTSIPTAGFGTAVRHV